MRFLHSFLILGVVNGALLKDNYTPFEHIHEAPEGWKSVGTPSDHDLISFKLALHAENPKLLEEKLREISSPDHLNYGNHLSAEGANQLMAPSKDGVQSVMNWLKKAGISKVSSKDEWIHFNATCGQANSLLDTKFETYRHLGKRDTDSIRTTKVNLPRSLLGHVKMIHPTTRFNMMKEQTSMINRIENLQTVDHFNRISSQVSQDSLCTLGVNPKCLMNLYKIGGVRINPEKAGRLGVGGFLNQWARHDDMAQFAQESAQWVGNANFTWESVNGGKLDQSSSQASEEANLDIQYTMSLSYPVKNHFYSTKGLGPLVPDLDQLTPEEGQNEPYLEFFTWLLKQEDIPHTLTFSYGENEQSVPKTYANQVCDMIGQLGTRGVSVIFSSGDTGVGSACQTNDAAKKPAFLPTFPAACPYVTSIGGTTGTNPERAVSFSSGGFSNLWARPWYQEKEISKFLTTLGKQWHGLYNASGRGFPDISAQGQNFMVIDQGTAKAISGTSASAPVVAGIVALLNAQRLQNNQPALGFLNPWLYQNANTMITDITSGKSSGCNGRDQFSGHKTPVVPFANWSAVPGWDAVTGLGTPLFDKMLKALPNASPTSQGPSSDNSPVGNQIPAPLPAVPAVPAVPVSPATQ